MKINKKTSLPQWDRLAKFYGIKDQAFSRARGLVVRSQTSEGPNYWIAPG